MIYPPATVACFDPTHGHLPRRELDRERLQQFLHKLVSAGAESVLIAASTGHGHLRTIDELREFFDVAAKVSPPTLQRMALLRPEDGLELNLEFLQVLKRLEYAVVFLRPGSNLEPDCTEDDIVEQLAPLVNMPVNCNCLSGFIQSRMSVVCHSPPELLSVWWMDAVVTRS